MPNIIVEEGMPRKGWHTVEVIDHDTVDHNCSLCGTPIRYEHIIAHPAWASHVSAGCKCAEYLSVDYVWRNKENWKTKSNSDITIDYIKPKNSNWYSVVVNDNGAYSWFIYDKETGDTYDSRLIDCYYETQLQAQDALYDVLEGEGWL